MRGTVKFFKEDRGFGFIVVEGDRDYFVHVSSLSVEKLESGQQVEFEVKNTDKGPEAINVKVIG